MRVQENVNRHRLAVRELQFRHFLRRQHLGDDALVAVASHQLVARLQGERARNAVLQPSYESRIAVERLPLYFRRIFDLDEFRRGGIDVPDRMDLLFAVRNFLELRNGRTLT